MIILSVTMTGKNREFVLRGGTKKVKNDYARKLQRQRIVMKDEERLALIRRTLTTVYYATAITLNDSFGFGAERIQRFREKLDETINDYGGLMDSVDADYADGKLEQTYKKIVGEDI